ncbi:catalase family peroxidase [Azohydromonas caseinilytica]|uniref:Catalase-related peroxidase n=1 Tax=Azohydromonas caseinilytica TaxID=2728836 RepID=A0A848FCH3_9BURK|nr:catalase family peroxidase [Azohydromonas caseinilytica]NML17174.1 catalase family peroxidase [Azohydromonas caseinilytica]
MTSRPAPLALATALAALASLAPAQPQAPADSPATPQALVDGFEGAFGKHPGQRRGGAKGLCAEGHFLGAAAGQALSSATAFSGKRIPVVARFSVSGGNPKVSDKARNARGLALQFSLPGGERWLMANISAPMHSASTPEAMLAGLEARRLDPVTKKPDPARVKAFNEAHPEGKAQADWFAQHGVPASYAAVNYWGVHAFRFTDAQGRARYAKWVFEPAAGQELLDDEQLKALPDDFLAEELRRRVAAGPVEYRMRLQLAGPGDSLVNPAVPWPQGRESATVGRLLITRVEPGPGGACEGLVFDPLVLPRGIEASDDPVLRARSAAYAEAAARRLSGR